MRVIPVHGCPIRKTSGGLYHDGIPILTVFTGSLDGSTTVCSVYYHRYVPTGYHMVHTVGARINS